MSNYNNHFKGVETFLRRIAFNLGNTPSQTEVKIISCIPIDVSDLQQKIAELEKKLEEHQPQQQRRCESHPTSPTVALAAPVPASASLPSTRNSCNCISVVNTAVVTNPISYNDSTSASHSKQKSAVLNCHPKYVQSQECKPQCHHPEHLSKQPPKRPLCAKNKTRFRKRGPNRTELVYYAKADESTPFNKYRCEGNSPSKNIERHDQAVLEETRYLSNVLWKQYTPRPALNDLSNHSEFSWPVCRDDPPLTTLYESDVCSCCHGPFQNLDEHMKPFNTLHDVCNPNTEKENVNKFSYYDSNAYDIVPVKENITKPETKHTLSKQKKKHIRKHDTSIKCWPENVTAKKHQQERTKCQNFAPMRNNPYKKYHKRDLVLRAMSSKSQKPRDCDRNFDDTRVCYVEYSDVYAKRKKLMNQKLNAIPKLNNASCLATVINNADCQTTETNEIPTEDKTATTLNQIKTILQSVLTEVKTNSKLGKNQEPKKDAIVQNVSQNIMCGGEQLLQSFTYSPYNMNPYIASCSRQMPSNSYCPTTTLYGQTKCMHYPLFVQPNRHMCSSCYKNGNGRPIGLMNHGSTFTASTATNTEERIRRSKETQKLIKDIYDSIALTIELPTKETTKSQGDQGANVAPAHNLKSFSVKEPNDVISEIYKNENPLSTSVTEKTDSKVTTNTISIESGYNNKRTVSQMKADTFEGNNTTSEQTHRKIQPVYAEESEDDEDEDEENESSDDINEDIIESSTHTEEEPEQDEDNTAESVQYESDKAQNQNHKKGDNKGLISKMLKIFQPRSKNKTKQDLKESPKTVETTSDSDDYQTVYSQKSTLKPRRKPYTKVQPYRKRNTFSPERSYRARNRYNPERVLHSPPYLQQEPTRYWDEKLIFQNSYENRSIERSVSRPYSRNYEARVAFANPDARIAPLKSTTYPVKKSSFARTTGNRLKKSTPKVGGLAWLKKHNLKVNCGKQWKKLILEG